MKNPTRILLVDDDPESLSSTRRILEFSGFEVDCAKDGEEALEKVRPLPRTKHEGASSSDTPYDLVISDVKMPRLSGVEFLRTVAVWDKSLPVILMTAYGSVHEAVWALKFGAVDFLTKPIKRNTLIEAVKTALQRTQGRKTQNFEEDAQSLIGKSQEMANLRDLIQRVAESDVNVLITGESGTGKELVAREIFRKSSRRDEPFVAVNCAAIPESLMESELFGHEKGAFSGADHTKAGLFEAADGGVLFLDEIGDLPLALQPKLLRALQDQELRRVGSTQTSKVNVRVLAATHQNLKERVLEGKFREDLLFRLDVLAIEVPPLRDRGDDLIELTQFFIREASARHRKELLEVDPRVLLALKTHTWPGNVRELSNVVERAVVLAQNHRIDVAELPPHLLNLVVESEPKINQDQITIPIGASLKEVEELMIKKTLEATSGDKNLAAKILGINSRTVYRKLLK